MDNPTNLVFVEDNPQDVQLFKYALKEAGANVNLVHYENGREFIAALPDLYLSNIACVLLDLNMPFVNGFEVLEKLKTDSEFQHLPVIVFTSTNSNEEKSRCYSLGANAYVDKPLELEDLVRIVKSICDFWVSTNVRIA